MNKEKNREIFRWIIFFMLPSIEIILLIVFTKIIVDETGWSCGILFLIIFLTIFAISVKKQIDKTLRIFGIE